MDVGEAGVGWAPAAGVCALLGPCVRACGAALLRVCGEPTDEFCSISSERSRKVISYLLTNLLPY